MWAFILVGVLFIAMGLAVHVFKWHFLISGYNTMPKKKKANVDTEGLGRLIGIYSYVNGGISIAAGVFYVLGLEIILLPVIVFFIISTVYLLIKAQKYDGNIYDENGKLRKGAWKQLVLPGVICVVTLIFVSIVMYFSFQPTKVSFLEEGIQIHGMYGEAYTWQSIENVSLKEELPTIEVRTNGSALGSKLKGHFRTKELGSVKLLVNTKNPPFIYIETDDGVTIFNMNDRDETQEIFREILKQIE
ncbi:MAG TPA: DUF3784 domain-containing protein [Clostridium sp.]|nr:DUF3784 domain-containing protein [Clostridium sp.]